MSAALSLAIRLGNPAFTREGLPANWTRTPGNCSRACDRCWSLKTQCDFASPCARCRRVGVACTNNRPIKARGRPRKQAGQCRLNVPSERHNHPRTPSPVPRPNIAYLFNDYEDSLPGHDVVMRLVQNIPGLPMGNELATGLLNKFLSYSRYQGLFSILPTTIHLVSSPGNEWESVATEILHPDLAHAFLAICLQTLNHTLPQEAQHEAEMGKVALRMSALSLVPNLTWKSRKLRIGDVLLLLFFSHTWSWTKNFNDISDRWNSLAVVIMVDILESRQTKPEHLLELERRTASGLVLQDGVLSLLHHRKPTCSNSKGKFEAIGWPKMNDVEWHSDQNSAASGFLFGRRMGSFFQLFNPLVNCLETILMEPEAGTQEWSRAYLQLEDYFLYFPRALLRFAELRFAYQAEAMIWVHGMFIMLHNKADLIDILFNSPGLYNNQYGNAFEHALLLGEVLPALLRLDPRLQGLSPATVYFLLLSSVTLATALRQFFTDTDSMSDSDSNSAPKTLVIAAENHYQALYTLSSVGGRFELDLISEIRHLLQYCLAKVTFADAQPPISCEILMRYRWKGKGMGVVAMDNQLAMTEWQYDWSPNSSIWEGTDVEFEDRTAFIERICREDSRVCQPGFFDLKISFF